MELKLKQIVVNEDGYLAYGLDENGQVWVYQYEHKGSGRKQGWKRMEMQTLVD